MKIPVLTCLLLASLFSGPVLALTSAHPEPGAPVLVIAWPWNDPAIHVIAAGGRVVGPVSAPMAVLATGTDPGFLARLEEMPGIAVRSGQRLAELCGVAV